MKSVGIVISTVGFHWEEVYDPYVLFKKAGWHVEFYSKDGKEPVADPRSLEKHEVLSVYGLGLASSFSPDTPEGQALFKEFNSVKPIIDIDTDFDALYISGGHGCLFDVNINIDLHDKIKDFYDQDKILAAVCHGTSAFAFVEGKNGNSIIESKRMTGFPELLDDILVKVGWVPENLLPIPYSNEAMMKRAGASISPFNFLISLIYPQYHVVDRPFITGIGPKTAENVARSVIELVAEGTSMVTELKRKRELAEY